MEETREGIFIRQDSLMERRWFPPVYEDEESDVIIKEGHYETRDVTNLLPSKLCKYCWIENGTTLRDFFKLLNNHKDILGVIFHTHWFEEWLEYGLRSPDMTLSRVREPGNNPEIECFQLSMSLDWELPHKMNKTSSFTWSHIGSDIKTRKTNIEAGYEMEEETNFVYSFCLMSEPLTEEQAVKSCYGKDYIGKRVPYGFFGSDICTYMDLPLRLSSDFEFCKASYDENDKLNGVTEVMHNFYGFKLFDIINEIFYEISFNGSPKMCQEKSDEICEMAKETEEEYMME